MGNWERSFRPSRIVAARVNRLGDPRLSQLVGSAKAFIKLCLHLLLKLMATDAQVKNRDVYSSFSPCIV